MNTRKERFLGLLRELLTAGGALAFGAFDGTASVVGLLVAIASVAWALWHHDGIQILETSIRKSLSALPGVLLAFGWVDPEKAGMLAAFIAPGFALVWSFVDNGGELPKSSGKVGALLFAFLAALALPSCVTTTAPDGTQTKRADQQAINPWMILARDLFTDPPVVEPIIVDRSK